MIIHGHPTQGEVHEPIADRAPRRTTGWRYTYDRRNRLVKLEGTSNIEATPPNWNVKAAYVYDGLNRRVKKDRFHRRRQMRHRPP